MTDPTLLYALCQKLGHGLEEVRVRALETLVSKLDRGFIKITDLVSTKDFLVKLLEWFGFQPCPAQERVLHLIWRILKEEGSEHLVAKIGAQRFLLALNTIRETLPSNLCSPLDDIVGLVHRAHTIQAQCDDDVERPLEASTGETVTQSGTDSDACFIDASLQEALQENPMTQDSSEQIFSHRYDDIQLRTIIPSNAVKILVLPWQPLISTDRHVLIAVENSLANIVDRTQLLNTCSFLTDVMMRDFPAEIFLQRPAIIMTFMKLMKSSLEANDRHLAKMIIACLLKLTSSLQCRLKFYQDPNMTNQNQERFLRHEEDSVSQVSAESLLSTADDRVNLECRSRILGWNGHFAKQSNSQTASQSTSQCHSFPPTNDDMERSHYSGTQVPSESTDSDESSLLRLRQCSLPQFCLLAMHIIMPHVDTEPESSFLMYKLSNLFTDCVTPQIWLAPISDVVASDIASHVHEMLEILGEKLQQDRSETESRLIHLQLLAVTRHFLQRLVPLEIADRCLPRQLKTALCSTLLDAALHAFFPTMHSDILQYAQTFKNVRDIDRLKLFESTLSVAESLSSAAKLLTQGDLPDGSKMVLNAECALSSLSFHQDLSFIPLVFDSYSKNYHSWHLSDSEHNTLSSILLKLLAHADLSVRRKAYSHLHKMVLDDLSVQHPRRNPAESLAFMLFNTTLLLEITNHGISSTDDLVQNCAEDIMLHALKGKVLLGSTYWTQFLSSLGPVLPLLQCWATKPSALGRAVVTMLHPDVGSQMNLETAELLKGNLRLQFAKDELVRREALSRLIWLLTKEEDAVTKLPHLTTLHNCATESICLVDKPIEVFLNVPDQSFYQESSLLQVLDIVKSNGLEPRMLLSALTQLAAILEDPRHHESFLSKGGLALSMEYLLASMSDKRFEVYPEVIVPVIGILRSLCLHNAITRHQISKNVGTYFSLLRGLIMFPSELRMRVNAAQLLAVLLYNDVIISASPHSLPDGFIIRGISVPHLIATSMNLPIICSTHWRTSHFTEPLMTDILLRHEECRVFLASAWNLTYFKCEQSPLLWESGTNLSKLISTAQEKFSSSLKLNENNLRILQSSAMLNLCQKQLIRIQEASTHDDVSKALEILRSILDLYRIVNGTHEMISKASSDTLHIRQLYKNLPWRQTFRRFLVSAPASFEDQQLLVHILQFLRIHVQIFHSLGFQSKDGRWLSKLLQHPSQPLPNLFHTVAHTGYSGDSEMPRELSHLPKWKELCKELLNVITECACFEQTAPFINAQSSQADLGASEEENKENSGNSQKFMKTKSLSKRHRTEQGSQTELERADQWVGEVMSNVAEETKHAPSGNWIHVIQNVVSCLKSSDTQHFYNLAYLDWLLWALTHLTGKRGWSADLNEAQLKAHFSELLNVLLELVQAFHLECGKGGSSYMGLSITRASVLCLSHLLEEMQQYQELKWEEFWLAATKKACRKAVYVPWLPSLFQSREPIVRATALSLAAGIATTSQGCDHIMNMFTDHSDVWMTPLCILLDHREASIVREQAANLLTKLLRNRSGMSGSGDNDFENASFDVLQHRVLECGFLSELWSTVDCLSLATCWDPNQCISGEVGIGLMHWSILKNSHTHLSSDHYIFVENNSKSADVENHGSSVPCTPSLMRSVCNFIDAIINMNNDALHTFAKEGVSGQLLRCLSSIAPLQCQNERAVQLYCDTLRMYSGICHVVNQCINNSATSCQYILQQPHIYHKLLTLLDPTLYCVDNMVLLKLRNELWTEVLWLISELLGMHGSDDSCGEENGHSVFHSLLIRSHGEPLASVLTVALSGSLLTDLQRAALACIQSLLSHPACTIGQPFVALLEDIHADFNSSIVTVKETDNEDSIGASLCRSLLTLYDVHSLQMGSAEHDPQKGRSDWRVQRAAVAAALAALLEVSVGAKKVALNHGLVELLCAQLGAIQSYLILEPRGTLKRLASKKKICPVLHDLDVLMGLLNCMVLKNIGAKQLATDIGVTDTIHKLWTWCLSQPSLLLTVVRLLATLTSGCPSAAHSLVLTSMTPGLGLRRTPSSQSLLHALVALVLHETEDTAGAHDLTVLNIAFGVLLNACHVPECRTALTKGNLLRGVRHLHSNLTKKSKRKKQIETLWLSLLVQLSAYQEGQVVLPKVPDLLDYILTLADGQRKDHKLALQVLRNIAFNPINRPRLLSSGEFLLLVNKKIRDGDTDEQVCAAAALWALIANNQKGKLTAKCSGTDVHILDSLRQLAVSQKPGTDFVAQLLNCVLRVLRHEPSHCVSQT